MPQNPYTFKIGLQDRATGWVKYGQHWYNPGVGRWTQMDTLDAPLDPANANRYAYAANDPVNNSDPLGLLTDDQKDDIAANSICFANSLFLGSLTAGLGTAFGAVCFMVGIITIIEED